jgi:hypothetical protein
VYYIKNNKKKERLYVGGSPTKKRRKTLYRLKENEKNIGLNSQSNPKSAF